MDNHFSFSQSSLQSYLNCRHQFFLRYIQRLNWPSSLLDPWNPAEIERQAGIRFHRLAQNFFLGVPEEVIRTHAVNDDDSRMDVWVSNLINAFKSHIGSEASPEMTMTGKIGPFSATAKFDLLVIKAHEIHIYDWKTSRHAPKAGWLRRRVQTQLYPLLALRAYQQKTGNTVIPQINFTYWEASFPANPIIFSIGENDLRQSEEYLIDLMTEITHQPTDNFYKTTHQDRCAYCLYRTYCHRQLTDANNLELEQDMRFTDFELPDISAGK